MRITLAQLSPTIGDFKGNFLKIKKAVVLAQKEKSDLICFSELFVTGYPPRDLLEKKEFIEKAESTTRAICRLSKKYPKIGILFGNITFGRKKFGNQIYNSAILIYRGKTIFIQSKSALPRRDVFDEPRYFEPASEVRIFQFRGERLGIAICADVWAGTKLAQREYEIFPIKNLAKNGPSLFIVINASPFYVGKEKVRFNILRTQAQKYKTPILYVNQVGGNDELIFDGGSMVVNGEGQLVQIFPFFKEDLRTIDTAEFKKTINFVPQEEMNAINNALVLGIKDYLGKCGFKKAVIGLSGGIDSSVTCFLAVSALGRKNVLGLGMPSPYSSGASVKDAKKLAKNLGIDFRIIPISPIYRSYLDSFKKHLGKSEKISIVEENLQARIRGNILMAFSNKFGHLVLSTGDKSELAVGYCTLYGDMTGGLGVISDFFFF